MKKPFFSVIIPTLNEEKYLPRLINNLENQINKNFETIIVDGKSTDATKKIIFKHKKFFNFKFIEIEPNLSNQKNLGGKIALGKYLIFIDADMLVSKYFTNIAEEQIKKKKGLIFLPYVIPQEKKEYPEINIIFPTVNKLVEWSQTINKPFSSGPSMIWEKNAFNLIGGFDNLFGEDHHIIRKAFYWGIKAKCLPKLKVNFSLRRMKKEGKLKLIYHFITAITYLLFKDKLQEKTFKYTMGGQVYNTKDVKVKKEEFFKGYLKQINKLFNKLIKD